MGNRYEASARMLERAKQVIAGGVSSEFRKYNHPHAIFYDRAMGSRIWDIDGNEYLDFTLSQGPLILGHSHPEVLQAVTEYSATGQMYAGQHLREVELAELLQRLIPSAELLRFCLDGSEAVQTAFRVARARTGRRKFIRFEGHYHGWLDNVAWGLSAPTPQAMGPLEQPTAFPWSQGISPMSREEFIILPWNDPEGLRRTLAEHHEDVAAIITEAVMCNNGCNLPAPGFLQEIRTLCDQYGIAFIMDEVITGFRLSLSGAQTYFNVTPDMSVFAKAMGSGYPISAVVGRREWMSLIAESKVIHAGTMNAGQPSVAAALAKISILERDAPHARMFALGQRLMSGLRQAAADAGHQMLVQGPGPMFVTAFTDRDVFRDYRDTLTADRARLGRFVAGMHDAGVRVIGRGLWYISAVHTDAEIDHAISTARDVLAAMD
ncbi:MAG: aspartate aminotransferase family protein [Chitinophagaceae bacterium]|nr:aspartate aminotransferase family protein [Chitinophagaceae bacterium]